MKNSGSNTAAFINLVKHPFKFRMFLLSQLPNAYFSGVRVREISEEHCVVSVPYKWFTKNPFRSTYFACLSMAAEMSTGVLSLAHSYKHTPRISMLVVKVDSEYFKKAVGRTHFTCDDGSRIRDAIGQARETGEASTVKAKSVGRNSEGVIVAEFYITWSFKAKK